MKAKLEKSLKRAPDARNGIILGENLITTFESENVPLDVEGLELILKGFV